MSKAKQVPRRCTIKIWDPDAGCFKHCGDEARFMGEHGMTGSLLYFCDAHASKARRRKLKVRLIEAVP